MQPYIDTTNRNFVTPSTHGEQATRRFNQQFPVADQNAVDLSHAFTSLEGVEEKTTGFDRAIALCLRLLPFSVLWFVLSYGVVWLIGLSDPVTYLLFALLTAVTYWRMDRQEYEFSRSGVERHKINTAAQLVALQMKQNQELRREALRAHLTVLAQDLPHARYIAEAPQSSLRQLTARD